MKRERGEGKIARKYKKRRENTLGKRKRGRVRASGESKLSASATFDSGKIHIDLSWIGTTTFGPGICQLESWERATKYETCREFFLSLSLFLSSREIDMESEGRLVETYGSWKQWFVDADK